MLWPWRLVSRIQTAWLVVEPVQTWDEAMIVGSAGLPTTTLPASGRIVPPSAFAFTYASALPMTVPGACDRLLP